MRGRNEQFPMLGRCRYCDQPSKNPPLRADELSPLTDVAYVITVPWTSRHGHSLATCPQAHAVCAPARLGLRFRYSALLSQLWVVAGAGVVIPVASHQLRDFFGASVVGLPASGAEDAS